MLVSSISPHSPPSEDENMWNEKLKEINLLHYFFPWCGLIFYFLIIKILAPGSSKRLKIFLTISAKYANINETRRLIKEIDLRSNIPV